jgi:Tfp pilus assembly protein PilF
MRSHRLACLITAILVALPCPALAMPLHVPRIDPNKTRLPLCKLTPSKLHPGLCVVKYRITTGSKECQDYFDQGLGYFYSYVWMEAARSFETAARYDPECPMAWWALSRALERYGRGNPNAALKKAQQFLSRASHRENLLITARLQEKGLIAGVGNPDARKLAAIKTLDTLLALYDDDEEGWYYRAQLAGGAGLFGGQVSSVPFYKALLRVNPLHPGANHELLHFYENFRRPALGWIYAENYIQSSPGLPHAFHMQAHLATRLGRWDKTSDRSRRAVELERAYHQEMNVRPQDDSQYTHHLEILMRSLTHDGRFREARQLKKECEDLKYYHHQAWFRLHLAERHWDEALKVAGHFRKTDKSTAAYMTALVYLHKSDQVRASSEVTVLHEAAKRGRASKELQNRLDETLGLLLCQQGNADAGLKVLAKVVATTKDDYGHHAWGNGAYYMVTWGIAALRSGRFDVAEEAFLESLAHDAGCFHAALGLQVLCEYQGRGEEAQRYAELAQRSWRHADPSDIVAEYLMLHEPYAAATVIPARYESGGNSR